MEDNKAKILETDEDIAVALAKAHYIAVNNVELSLEEMNKLQDFLHKCYQMGWLNRYKPRERGMYAEFFVVDNGVRYNAKEVRMSDITNTLITKIMDGFEEIIGLNVKPDNTNKIEG